MKIKKSRAHLKKETRDALHQTAIDIFYKKGISHTQIKDITSKAEVAIGTFYVHYKNKEELINDILKEFNLGYIRIFQEIIDPDRPINLEDIVPQISSGFLNYWQKNLKVVAILVEATGMKSTLKNIGDGISPELVDFIVHALTAQVTTTHSGRKGKKQSEELISLKNRLIIHGLFGMWLRIGLQFLSHPEITPELAQDTLTQLTLNILRPLTQAPK